MLNQLVGLIIFAFVLFVLLKVLTGASVARIMLFKRVDRLIDEMYNKTHSDIRGNSINLVQEYGTKESIISSIKKVLDKEMKDMKNFYRDHKTVGRLNQIKFKPSSFSVKVDEGSLSFEYKIFTKAKRYDGTVKKEIEDKYAYFKSNTVKNIDYFA